jgi:RNA-binding protein
MDKKELRRKAHSLKPLVRIGKNGINEAAVAEVLKQVKKHKLLKVKMLSSFDGDRKQVAKELAVACESELVSVVGGTIVLWRR